MTGVSRGVKMVEMSPDEKRKRKYGDNGQGDMLNQKKFASPKYRVSPDKDRSNDADRYDYRYQQY